MKQKRKFEAVVIGGSLGGMDAVIRILACLPTGYKLSMFIVLHRMKVGRSPLIDIVGSKTNIIVKEADEKEQILPGHAYIAPADYHLLIEPDKTLSLDSSEKINFSRPSIDATFETAATIYKDKLLAVILTGANQDGSEGIRTVSRKGGYTIAQEPSEAASPVMPEAAIRTDHVDEVMRLEQICKFLLEISENER